MTISKELLASNLTRLLDRYGESQAQLAQAIGTSTSAISAWATGIRFPRVEYINAIADHFGVDPSVLLNIQEHKASIPVLGHVHAGDPTFAEQETLDYIDISDTMAKQGEYFALYVEGDSMAPDFQDGDTVIVQRQPVLETGDIGVFSISGEDATIKEYKRGERNIFLIPHNESYSILMYSFKEVDLLPVLTLGKVVELRRSF